MAFEGDLSNLSLGDVLQTLAMTRQAGTFVIRGPSEERRLVFGPRGFGLLTVRKDVRDRVGGYLVGKGKVTPAAFEQAQKALRRKKDAVLEDTLCAGGSITEADVLEARRYVAGEDIYDLFLWTSGTFEFIAGEAGDAAPYGNAWFDVMSVAMEAARRMDEVGHLRTACPLTTVLVHDDDGGAPNPAKFNADTMKLYALIDGTQTVEAFLAASHIGRFDTWKALDSLREGHFVREATPHEMAVAADASMRSKDHARAVGVLRRLLELSPDDTTARKGLIEALTASGDKRGAAAEWITCAQRADAAGDSAAAANAFEQAVRLEKGNATAQEGLARALLASGEKSAGADAAKIATALYVDAREFTAAIEIAELAVRECEEDASLRITLANAHAAAGDPANALLMLDDAASLLETTAGDERRLLDVYRRIIQLDPGRKDCTRRIEAIESTSRFRRRKLAQRAAVAVGVVLAGLIAVPMMRGPGFDARLTDVRTLLAENKVAEAEAILSDLQAAADDDEMTAINTLRDDIAKRGPRKRAEEAAARLAKAVDDLSGSAADTQTRDWAGSLALYQQALDLLDGPDAKLLGATDLARLSKIRAGLMVDLGASFQALYSECAANSTTVTSARDKFGPDVFKKMDGTVLQDLVERTDAVAKIRAAQDWPATRAGVEAIRKRVAKSKDDVDRKIVDAIDAIVDGFPVVEREGARALAALRTKQLLERSSATHAKGQSLLGEGKLEDARTVYTDFLKFCAELRAAEPHELYEVLDRDYLIGMDIEAPKQERLNQIETILRAESEADAAIEKGDVPTAFRIRRDLYRVHRNVDFHPRFQLPLRIESRPSGAAVFVLDGSPSGKPIGRTPIARFDYKIDAGAKLVVRLDGYEERTIERRGALEDGSGLESVELPKKPEFTAVGVGNIKAPVVIVDGRLVLAGRDGLVRLHAARDGSEVVPPFSTKSLAGVSGAPAAFGGRVFVATGNGSGFVLDGRTLQKLREISFDGPVAASLLATATGVFCVTESGVAQLLDGDGNVVWTKNVGKVLADPALAGNRIVVTNCDGELVVLEASSGSIDARIELPEDPRWSGPVTSGDRAWVAGDGGAVACVDLRDKSVSWCVPLGTALRARPVLSDGRLLVATASGSLLSLDPSSGRELGREVLGAPVRFPPVTLDAGWAVVTEKGQVLRFDATGALVWRYDAKEDVVSPATLVGGRLVFVTKRGTLVSLRP